MSKSRTFEFLRRPGMSVDATASERPYFIWGASDLGLVRDNNEDQFVVANLARSLTVDQCSMPGNDGVVRSDELGSIVLVADGMGGQLAGEVASALAVDGMLQYAFSLMPWLRTRSAEDEVALAEGLTQTILRSQERMAAFIQRKRLDGHMGTTLTMGYVQWPTLYLVHVGDSRAYLSRRGQLFRLTRDHNLADEMVRSKAMTEEEARTSNFSSVLTNCISTSSEETRVELHQIELLSGDRVLFCTDGLYGPLRDSQIRERLNAITNDEGVLAAVTLLIEDAKDANSDDNITAAVLSCR